MKKIFLLLLASFFVYLLHAQNSRAAGQTILLTAGFEKIQAGNDVTIILTEGVPGAVHIKGKAQASVTVTDGVLYIKKDQCCNGGSIVASISVQGLKSVELNEGSAAFSKGQLLSDRLTVILNGDSYCELKSKGSIKLVYKNDLDLDLIRVKDYRLLETAVLK